MKKVLIVDDNKNQQFYLTHFLIKYFDCKTLTADNGEEGLELIQKEHPDLILLDIAMPIMDGIKMLENLRFDEKKPFIPVIIMTALDEKSTLLKLLALGISDYISKPLSVFSMYNKFERFLQTKNIT